METVKRKTKAPVVETDAQDTPAVAVLDHPDVMERHDAAHAVNAYVGQNGDSPEIRMQYVTPTEAEHLLVSCAYERQRAPRPYHVQFLSYLMQQRRFREATSIDLAILPDGRRYLVNGQHTLSAIVHSGTPALLTIFTRQLQTQEQVARLYASFDRQLTRTPADMMRAYDFAAQYGLTSQDSGALYSAMKLILSGFTYTAVQGTPERSYLKDEELLYTAMCQWAGEARQFAEDCQGATAKIRSALRRQGIYAMALVTYRHLADKAQVFWTSLAKDEGKVNDPSKTLLHFLLQTTAVHFSPMAYARCAAQAWNAFLEERTLAHITRPHRIESPIAIKGTPHTGTKAMAYISPQWEILSTPQPLALSGVPLHLQGREN